jgi:hypothetical protein
MHEVLRLLGCYAILAVAIFAADREFCPMPCRSMNYSIRKVNRPHIKERDAHIGAPHVRFGSKADMAKRPHSVRFTPESRH